MSDPQVSSKKDSKSDKKALLSSLAQTVNPIMKELEDQQALQMPELALRCAQFFHSISRYCVGYYNNYIRQQDTKKTKLIKKQEKEKEGKGMRRPRKKQNNKDAQQNLSDNKLEPPKKPLTAYIIYFQDKKPLFVERYPDLNLSELTKLIAKEWKELSQAEKQVYLDRAAEDRKRYQQQLTEFKALFGKIEGNKISEQFDIKADNPMEQEDIEAIIKAEQNKHLKQKQEEKEDEKEEAEAEAEEEEEDNEKLGEDQEEEQEGPMEAEAAEEGAEGESGSEGQPNEVKGSGSGSDQSSQQAEQQDSAEPSPQKQGEQMQQE